MHFRSTSVLAVFLLANLASVTAYPANLKVRDGAPPLPEDLALPPSDGPPAPTPEGLQVPADELAAPAPAPEGLQVPDDEPSPLEAPAPPPVSQPAGPAAGPPPFAVPPPLEAAPIGTGHGAGIGSPGIAYPPANAVGP